MRKVETAICIKVTFQEASPAFIIIFDYFRQMENERLTSATNSIIWYFEHFEHTVAVRNGKAEILSSFDEIENFEQQ